MKKIALGLIAMLLLVSLTTPVLAERAEDKTAPIANFKVFKWVNQYIAPNEVVVLTVNSGQRGYVVISATTEDKYSEGLAIAKKLLKTTPTQTHGTKFAYIRARI